MARQQTKQANQLFGESQQQAAGANANATAAYNQLFPAYSAEASNPTGFGASGLAATNTAAGESAAGSGARARGEAALSATRTRNAGGYTAGADAAGREAAVNQSDAALQSTVANEKLKQVQKQQGLAGMAGLYNTNVEEALRAMGLSSQAINDAIQSGKSGWMQNMTGLVGALAGPAAYAYGK
jgi:hypothetical protein